MGNFLRIVILALGTGFAISVVHLLIKNKISERNSLIWLLGSVVVFIFSIDPLLLDKIAKSVGVDYPPTLLFLIAILILLFITLYHSVQISTLNAQVRELTQQFAIQNSFRERKYDSYENEEPYTKL